MWRVTCLGSPSLITLKPSWQTSSQLATSTLRSNLLRTNEEFRVTYCTLLLYFYNTGFDRSRSDKVTIYRESVNRESFQQLASVAHSCAVSNYIESATRWFCRRSRLSTWSSMMDRVVNRAKSSRTPAVALIRYVQQSDRFSRSRPPLTTGPLAHNYIVWPVRPSSGI